MNTALALDVVNVFKPTIVPRNYIDVEAVPIAVEPSDDTFQFFAAMARDYIKQYGPLDFRIESDPLNPHYQIANVVLKSTGAHFWIYRGKLETFRFQLERLNDSVWD